MSAPPPTPRPPGGGRDDGAAPALDRDALRRHQERWAGAFDELAVLADTTRDELLERLDLVRLAPHRLLDAGAATGRTTQSLRRRFPAAEVVAVEAAAARCALARRRRGWPPWRRPRLVRAELDGLPFAAGSFDLVFSNLALQRWLPLDPVLAELQRVLRAEGLLTFATLGPGTLRELREAWAAVDPLEHVHPFVDMHDLGEALLRAGFRDPVLDVERFTLTYPDFTVLLRELRAMGGASAAIGRRRTLTGRGRLGALAAAYERHRRDGVLPLTCEVVFGHAWAGSAPPARERGAGVAEVLVRPGEIRRRTRDGDAG